MKHLENQVLDQERALYAQNDLHLRGCRFDGPADGESALKECSLIRADDCYFNLRYPFWHNTDVQIRGGHMTGLCRAALWYCRDVTVRDSRLHGIKALRQCEKVILSGCDVISPEFGWFTQDLRIRNCRFQGEYFLFQAKDLHMTDSTLKGKYSFQYIENAVLEGCDLDTKDAFWHAKNVTVRNSTLRGEYLGWYCENVTFINCRITGTQPLCYCKGLRLIDCEMVDTDLSFERSQVDATLTAPIHSIKNPLSGIIRVPAVGQLIMDEPFAKAEIQIQA